MASRGCVLTAKALFRWPFQWREFILQVWFLMRVSLLPAMAVSIPLTVLLIFTRRIGDAVRAVARSQVELADAVAEARVHGHTWTQIAAMLGTSRQAAQERYGEPAEHP